jgi:tetratricopeptide (TPR) repeat protein
MEILELEINVAKLPETLLDRGVLIAELSKNGYQFLKEQKLEEAKECFQKILVMDTENNYALVGLGDAARKHHAYRQAAQYYERCLLHHPGNNYAFFGLADCYKTLNQYDKAIEIWDKYLEHDPMNITVLTRVADAYRKLHDFKNSKQTYQQVLEIEENNAYAIIGLGHLHYDFKEYRDALFYWEKMLETHNIANVDIRVLTSIGNCFRKLKAFDDGIAYFDAALKRERSNFFALFGLGDCFRGLNQPKRALDYWNMILNHDPRNKVILTRAGDAYCALRDYEKAAEYYQRALDIDFDVYAVLGLSIIAKVHGAFEKAIQSLQALLEHDIKNHRLYIELADCYLRIGDKEAAISILRDFQRFGIRNNTINEILEKLTMHSIDAQKPEKTPSFEVSKNWYILAPDPDGIESINELSRMISLLRKNAGLSRSEPPVSNANSTSSSSAGSAEIIINYDGQSRKSDFAWRAAEERVEIYAHSLESLDHAIADFIKALGISRTDGQTVIPAPKSGSRYLLLRKANHSF